MQIEHPYGDLASGQWLKGNLHTHSTFSDGQHERQDVLKAYADAQYDFLMMSDHDVYTSQDDLAACDDHGMVLVPGNEVSRDGVHILHVHADSHVAPHEDRQQVIDEINQGSGFAVVAHPNWYGEFNHCPHEKLRDWQAYAGLEIYNGVIGRLEGSPYATNHWDRLLRNGRRVWGYANDDMHSIEAGDLGLGWNVVSVTERTPTAIADALRNGRFYASTGVVIRGIEVSGSRIRIETENAERIVALQDTACRFATADDKSIEVDIPEDTAYVRFECWGRGESFAWTQPFRVTG